MNYLTLDTFLKKVRSLADCNFQNQEVKSFLGSNLLEPTSLAPYIFWKPTGYSRNLAHKDDFCELLVICWSPGAVSPIHGHENQKCWVRVERGILLCQNYSEKNRRGSMSIVEPAGKAIQAVRGYVDGPTDIHRVENPSKGEPAISLHLYARPYSECEVFDPKSKSVRRVRMQYDTCYGRLTRFS